MRHEVTPPRNFEDPSRHSRIDIALMAEAPDTVANNFEVVLVSDTQTFTDIVYRDGLPVSAMILFGLDSGRDSHRGVSGYRFEDSGHGWEVSERRGAVSNIDDIKFRKLPKLTDTHVELIEATLESSDVVGFSQIQPNRQQQISKIKKGVWSAVANTFTSWAQKAGTRAGHRDDRSNRVPGVKPRSLDR